MMAKAKLSGSLLAHTNARPPAEQGQGRAASSRMTVDQSFAFPAGRSTSPSLLEKQGRGTAISAGLAVCGASVAVVFVILFSTRPSEQIREPIAALRSEPPSRSAPEPAQNRRIPEVPPGPQATAAGSGAVEVTVPPAPSPSASELSQNKQQPPEVPLGSQATTAASSGSVEVPITRAASPSASELPQNKQQTPEAPLVSQATAASSGPAEVPVPPAAIPAPTPAVGSDQQFTASAATISARSEPGVATSPRYQSASASISTEEVSALRVRGDALFGNGDVVSARLFYQRAAEGGDGQAALQLGETYDPAFLRRAGINSIRGDVATAKRWYQQAFELGAGEAQILLKSTTDR